MPCTQNNHGAGTGPGNAPDGNRIAAETFANVFARAYLEASSEVQAVINEMSRICADEGADADTRASALDTLTEALFPQMLDEGIGIDLDAVKMRPADGTDVPAIQARMADEEARFADRLQDAMKRAGVTQAELAKTVGVQQPAVSMMLSRQCRPQRRTIAKLAAALKVDPRELWPGYST